MIGDTRQHEGVEAGRPFQQLQEAGMRTAKLEEIVRQKDPSLKATVELLADGQTAAAIEALKRQGRVKQITDPQERIQTIARNYVASPDPTSFVSPGRPPFLGCSFHDGRGMARSGGESTVSCNECSSEFLGKHDVGRIIGREIVTELPDAQEHRMGISSNTEIQQIAERLVSTVRRDHPLHG